MKNTIDLTEKRIFRKKPPQSILGDRQNVTIKIEKGRKKFPWKEYESTDALISDNCNKLTKLKTAISNSTHLSSSSLDRTIFTFRLGENDERVWYTYSNSQTSSNITPLSAWNVDNLETIPLNFNQRRTISNDLVIINDAYILDRLPHPLNKKRIQTKLDEIDRSQKWRKIWKSPEEKFEKRSKELPWNKRVSFYRWKWFKNPNFESSMPPYHYATILDAMEEAAEMDENGWRPLRSSRNPVPWNNYGNGKKNPLNTFNLPEEYYDNYDDVEMPGDHFFLNTDDTTIRIVDTTIRIDERSIINDINII